ncbi:hypothetical protein [Candidatus Puniceispirillum marinum]|uniref:Uncharacterized protein n=1 Tax=Puniceispirillum marinum (strain IMCC1322) TaxID=488538 RepID=D5BNA6_PUNMI|nr:hypothetical protein [Candidatus Puniceispirillum marinum]ADE40299.1 hypothetical protein SAR116_2056 [Candidatus Puniceispirillum marinum IMCC1322]
MQSMIDVIRFGLLCAIWLVALIQIIAGEQATALSDVGVIMFVIFGLLTVPKMRRDSFIILLLLGFVAWLLLDHLPTSDEWFEAGRRILIFAALLPTMILVRATAETMPSVHKTQQALATLPPEASSGGLQMAGHVFGGVINTGAFAMLSAALPPNSDMRRRRMAAEAALRGMVSSCVWSPFFVAFAIGQIFVPVAQSWIAIALGLVTAIIFALITVPLFSQQFSFAQLRMSLACLQPVSMRLLVVLMTVIAAAVMFNLTALSTVVIVMPCLVAIQFVRHRANIPVIMTQTRHAMTNIGDDIIIITVAMIVGFFATQTNVLQTLVASFYVGVIPGWFALIATPTLMMMASVVGVHPVITSTALLAIFSRGGADVQPALLMQSHLIGWGAGTMASVASLSVITCASLYNVTSRDLVLGSNLPTAFCYAFGGGIILALVNMFV